MIEIVNKLALQRTCQTDEGKQEWVDGQNISEFFEPEELEKARERLAERRGLQVAHGFPEVQWRLIKHTTQIEILPD